MKKLLVRLLKQWLVKDLLPSQRECDFGLGLTDLQVGQRLEETWTSRGWPLLKGMFYDAMMLHNRSQIERPKADRFQAGAAYGLSLGIEILKKVENIPLDELKADELARKAEAEMAKAITEEAQLSATAPLATSGGQ